MSLVNEEVVKKQEPLAILPTTITIKVGLIALGYCVYVSNGTDTFNAIRGANQSHPVVLHMSLKDAMDEAESFLQEES